MSVTQEHSVGAFEYCTSCGVRYSPVSMDGGRCIYCLSMICGVDCSTKQKEQHALQQEAEEMLTSVREMWPHLTPKARARLLRLACEMEEETRYDC